MGISAFLIVLNEEENIARTLDSLKWADERIVVDGGSLDGTVSICRSKGAKVFERAFDDFASQKNFALSHVTQEWALSIDADEIVSLSLANEIQEIVSGNGPKTGYLIKRRNYFLGKPMRFGRQGNEFILRLFRKNKGQFVGAVHEVIEVDGPMGTLTHVLEHYGTKTFDDYKNKFKLYTDLEASRMISEGRVPSLPAALLFPLAKWLRDYGFRGGFLDGLTGFYYHALSCYYGWVKNLKAHRENQKQVRA